jgi:hypothetical protein
MKIHRALDGVRRALHFPAAQILPGIKKRPEEISDEETAQDRMRRALDSNKPIIQRVSSTLAGMWERRLHAGALRRCAPPAGAPLMHVLIVGNNVRIGTCELLNYSFQSYVSCVNASIYILSLFQIVDRFSKSSYIIFLYISI